MFKKLGLGIILGASLLLGACGSITSDVSETNTPIVETNEEDFRIKGDVVETVHNEKIDFNAQPLVVTTENGKTYVDDVEFDIAPKGSVYEVKFDKHVDGDTTWVISPDGERVKLRYLLIDTPETVHPTLGEQPFGKEASKLTEKLTSNATRLFIEFDTTKAVKDNYDRYLVYVYADGKSVQGALISEGLARYGYVYNKNSNHTEIFSKLQDEAEKKAKNIWAIKGYVDNKNDEFNESVLDASTDTTTNEEVDEVDEVATDSNGSCVVQANENSKIYHVEGGAYYNKMSNPVCFDSEQEAIQHGYRASKR